MSWHNESRRHSLASKGIKTTMKDKPMAEYNPTGFSTNEFEIIGKNKGLAGRKLSDYVEFMEERFPNEKHSSYAGEWAGRFRDDREWDMADGRSRQALIKANPKKYFKEKSRDAIEEEIKFDELKNSGEY